MSEDQITSSVVVTEQLARYFEPEEWNANGYTQPFIKDQDYVKL